MTVENPDHYHCEESGYYKADTACSALSVFTDGDEYLCAEERVKPALYRRAEENLYQEAGPG